MRARLLCEIVEPGNKAPVSDWLIKNLTVRELGRFHTKVIRLEIDAVVSENLFKPYRSLKMWEIRFDNQKKVIRVLCEVAGNKVIMLEATQKKGKIKTTEEDRAKGRRLLIKQGIASVREYLLPGRPSADMGQSR